MLEAVSLFVICLITHFLDCYVFSKLINEKFKINVKNILIIVVLSIIDYIISMYNTDILKFIMSNLVTFIILKLLYKKSISKTLIGTIITYMLYILVDAIFSIIFIGIIGIKPHDITDNFYWLIFVNIFDYTLYILILRIKWVIKVIKKIMDWYEDKKIIKLIVISIIVVIICYTLLYSLLFNGSVKYEFIIFSVLVGIIVFVFGYFNEKSNNNKLTVEYTQLLEYVKDYEKEVVEKGKRQHEYKNQLIVINDMIPRTNKKLKKYIEDKLEIEENMKDNIWLEKLTNLPSGGIKGLIYFKLKKMVENNIDVYIDVDKELSDENKWFNADKYLEDYTRILGVYLDNAIEASIESKDKQIIIEFVENKENIEFILSNTYNGVINYQDIDKEKFSTKGKGRGYGLSLVKEIIEKNKLLNQTREINGKFYVQKLTIKK